MCLVSSEMDLYIHEWDGNAIVYQSLTGETHHLNGLAIETLKLLQEAPVTLTTLTNEILAIFQVEDKLVLEQKIKQLINEFENLGLINSFKREN